MNWQNKYSKNCFWQIVLCAVSLNAITAHASAAYRTAAAAKFDPILVSFVYLEKGIEGSADNIALLPCTSDAGWVKGEVADTREAARKAAIKFNIVDIKYGHSVRGGQPQLAAQMHAEHGKILNYILGCTGCAPS